MAQSDIEQVVEKFTEDRDSFTIGMEYLVAGMSAVQLFLQHVQRGTLEGPRHLPLLDRAEEMLQLGRPKIEDHPEVLSVVDRYVALVADLTALVDVEPDLQ